ncbi:protein of unknown function [Methylorubrum extorquens DM4]|uniref:Uncharacterized protein n=1 Tax=Methylorubrum extorquens (strain DSM 6343 / CIP 106787 / DM4) TaxID=661410 RepID=C7CJP9_METED|nr:protein of unknown function [Methylorubrum extorquens DM4]
MSARGHEPKPKDVVQGYAVTGGKTIAAGEPLWDFVGTGWVTKFPFRQDAGSAVVGPPIVTSRTCRTGDVPAQSYSVAAPKRRQNTTESPR